MKALELLIAERDKLQPLFDQQTTIEQNAVNEKLRLQGKNQVLTELINQLQPKEDAVYTPANKKTAKLIKKATKKGAK